MTDGAGEQGTPTDIAREAPPLDAAAPKEAPASPTIPGGRRTLIAAAAVLLLLVVLGLVLYRRSAQARRDQEALLKATLDRLVTAQEGFYYDSSRYGTSLRALPALQVPPDVRLEITTPASRSWAGVVTHALLPGRYCIVWVGTPPTSLPDAARVPENETKPLCFDGAPPSR